MGQSGEKSEIPLTSWLIKKHNNDGFQVINRFKWVIKQLIYRRGGDIRCVVEVETITNCSSCEIG